MSEGAFPHGENKMHSVSRWHAIGPDKRMTIQQALIILGVDWPWRAGHNRATRAYIHGAWRFEPQGFWERNADNLDEIGLAIKSAYKQRMRHIHPDTVYGNADEAALLNTAYHFCKKLFKRRGVMIQ